jgi:pyridoxine 5-phosphate synthase
MRSARAGATRRRQNGIASVTAPRFARGLGLEVHAGHGLDYASTETIAALP